MSRLGCGNRLWPLLAVSLLAGCTSVWTRREVLPQQYTVVREQLVIHGDFELPAHHRLVEELAARRADVLQRLGLPGSDEPIHIYLFESGERFESFVRQRHPEFPDRRAFFLETDTRLQVYAQWGDRVAEDLRHEVTHGYLHSAVAELPLWLDEGLAEYFEVPRGRRGLNPTNRKLLLQGLKAGTWTPNLPRLERMSPSYDMTAEDYAEAWAWVHLLLEAEPAGQELLCRYLQELRQAGGAAPLSARLADLFPQPDQALLAHLREWTAGEAEVGQPPASGALPPPTP